MKDDPLYDLLPARWRTGRIYRKPLLLRTCRHCLYHFAIPDWNRKQQYCDRKCHDAAQRSRARLDNVLMKRSYFRIRWKETNPVVLARQLAEREMNRRQNHIRRVNERFERLYALAKESE